MTHPPIAPNSQIREFEGRVSIDAVWGETILNENWPQGKAMLAAVAEVEWRKEAERLAKEHDTCECSRCCDELYSAKAWELYKQYVEPALDNANAWRDWGEAR